MTSRRLFLTLTLVTSLYAALPSQPPNISSQELVASLPINGNIVVSGLKFAGGRISVLSLPAPPTSVADLHNHHQHQQLLEYEQALDAATGSWTLRIVLPNAGSTAAGPATLAVWCDVCTSQGSPLSAQLASLPLEGDRSGSGAIVVLLTGAAVPASEPPAGASRALLQSSGSNTLTVGSKQYSFDNVLDLSQGVGTTFKLYYTLAADGTLNGALTCAVGASRYCGLGWGYAMIGSQCVVVTSDFVDGYHFTSASTSGANSDKGSWPLSATSNSANGNTLSAVFTASGISPGSQSMVWAVGDYSSGMLQTHFGGGAQGALQATFQASGSGGSSPSPTSSPSSASSSPKPPSASPSVVFSPRSGEHEGHEGHDDDGDEGGRSKLSPSFASGYSPSPSGGQSPSPSPVASGSSATTLASGVSGTAKPTASTNSKCTLSINGTTSTFNACMLVSGIGQNFHALWNYTSSPTNSSTMLLTMGLNTTDTAGYVAVGWPTMAGMMTDASSIILQSSSSAPSGVTVGQWWMSGIGPSNVNPGGQMTLSGMSSGKSNGWLTAQFTVELPATTSASSGRRLLARALSAATASYIYNPPSQNLLWAAGPVSGDTPLIHDSFGSSDVNLLAGASAAGNSSGGVLTSTVTSTSSFSGSTVNWHAWLSTVGWGVLIPSGIVAARCKGVGPESGWFQAHRAFQTIGFIMATVGFGLGFNIQSGWNTYYTVHRDLGVAATALGGVQMTALALRPKPGTTYRPAWAIVHHWLGRSATAVAIANIYYGIINVQHLGTWAWASYTAVLGVIVAIGVVNEIMSCATRRECGAPPSPPFPGSMAEVGANQFLSSTATADVRTASSTSLCGKGELPLLYSGSAKSHKGAISA